MSDLKRLLHDKRALAGVGVVGLVAVVAFARKHGTGGGGSTSDAGGVPVAAGAPVGAYDSTGSDIASTLGTFAQEQQQQLAAFASTLNSSLAGMTNGGQNTPTNPTSSVPTTSTPSTPTPAAAPAKPSSSPATSTPGPLNRGTIGNAVAKYVTVKDGQNWTTLEKSSGDSAAQLRQLNGGALNRLTAGQKVRIG